MLANQASSKFLAETTFAQLVAEQLGPLVGRGNTRCVSAANLDARPAGRDTTGTPIAALVA